MTKLNFKREKNFTDNELDQLMKFKKTEVDMDNVINSIHNSRALYKVLTKKCHPDKFINDPKHRIAEEIFQEISRYERNFDKLNFLKNRAINELNITF